MKEKIKKLRAGAEAAKKAPLHKKAAAAHALLGAAFEVIDELADAIEILEYKVGVLENAEAN